MSVALTPTGLTYRGQLRMELPFFFAVTTRRRRGASPVAVATRSPHHAPLASLNGF